MKCPACGFETPDTQPWCDFCKEPFRHAQAKPEHVPPSIQPSTESLPGASVKDMPEEKVFELLKLDAQQERIPPASPAARYLAWAFLALVSLMLLLLSFIAIRKAQRGEFAPHQGQGPSGSSAPSGAQAPTAP